MTSIRTLVVAGFCASLVLGQGQRNVTVANTDPSIKYEGSNIRDTPICKIDSDGFVTSKPGCFLLESSTQPCAESFTVGWEGDSAASLVFKGSAIYVRSALYQLSPLYTVTLDGQAEDVDGFRGVAGPLTCEILFSRTGLDPNVDHTITLSAKGPSPQRNSTDIPSERPLVFSFIDFTYTIEGSSNSTTPSPAGNNSLSIGAAASPSPSSIGTPSEQDESTGITLSVPCSILIVSVLVSVLSLA